VAEEAGEEAEGLEPEPGVPRLLYSDVLLQEGQHLVPLGQRQEVLHTYLTFILQNLSMINQLHTIPIRDYSFFKYPISLLS
jgi:hypothetical protein